MTWPCSRGTPNPHRTGSLEENERPTATDVSSPLPDWLGRPRGPRTWSTNLGPRSFQLFTSCRLYEFTSFQGTPLGQPRSCGTLPCVCGHAHHAVLDQK